MKNKKIIELGIRIENRKKEKKITNHDISEQLGVTTQAVSKVISKLKNGESCNLNTFIKILEILGIEIKNCFF